MIAYLFRFIYGQYFLIYYLFCVFLQVHFASYFWLLDFWTWEKFGSGLNQFQVHNGSRQSAGCSSMTLSSSSGGSPGGGFEIVRMVKWRNATWQEAQVGDRLIDSCQFALPCLWSVCHEQFSTQFSPLFFPVCPSVRFVAKPEQLSRSRGKAEKRRSGYWEAAFVSPPITFPISPIANRLAPV